MKLTYTYRNAFRILKGGKISLVVTALVAGSTILSASPSGGSVTSGTTSITQSGSVTTINQTSQKTAINWQDFSIAKNETVTFNQPNASAIALNRVVGNEKSIIDGALNANGQVWILNSNGVLFNSTASINTAGFFATTKTLSDTDFNAGNYTFKGDSTASIINMGTMTISNSGSAVLLANSVSNQGNITAVKGTVALVGANEATINLNGNSLVSLHVNKGVLDALVENKGAIIADGGQIYLTTNAVNELLKGVVNNTGVIEANSLDDIQGTVVLYAHGGTTNVSGSINAIGGSIETSGKSLHVSDITTIKANEWLLDPTDITIESTGGTDMTGSSISAGTIDTTLNNGTNVTLSADNNIYVNQALTWSAPTKLTLSAGNQINVNAVIENTNTTNGGVYFQAANTTDAVTFSTSGKVIINNAYQLQWMNTALGGTYTLGSNIDASGTSTWNSGAGFVPIGDYNTNYFTGTFDGLGHTISGLTIYLPEQWSVGLFGAIKDNALIQNIGLVNETITGNVMVGGLVGENEATVINAYTTGSIYGNGGVGGLVGRNYYSSITGSHSTANVTGIPVSDSSKSSTLGGLVGINFGGSITDSYATGSVIGNAWIGGLVGNNIGSSTITNSYATGSVNAAVIGVREGTYITGGIGGLVGNNTGTITNSYATGNVTGYLAATGPSGEGYDGAEVGGLVGSNAGTITNSYATGNVIGRNYVGGLIGRSLSGSRSIVIGSYATGNVTGSAYFGGFIGANEGSVTDSYATGNVTLSAIGDPYVLFPLGAGSSGYISGYLGGFVGKNSGTITNSYAMGSVTGSNYVGGFVGYNYTGTITNAYWDKDTSGQSSAIGGNDGGTTTNLVGINSSTGTINTFTQATYTGFDFANTWVIYEGYTRPLLRSFMTALTVTANDVVKIYDAKTYTGGNGVTYSIATPDSSLLLGSLSYTNTGDMRNVGTSSITGKGLYSSQQGYLISYASGTLSITPKSLIVTATANDKTYDGTTAATASLFSADVIFEDIGTLTLGGTATFADKNAATGKTVTVASLTKTGTNAGNYTISNIIATDLADITPKALTVTGTTTADKVYNGDMTSSTTIGTLSGLVGSETLSASVIGTFSDKNAAIGKTVTDAYILANGTGLASNYSLADTTSTATITPKALIVTATADDKTYDATTTATATLSSADVISGDTVTLGGTANFADKNAAIGKTVTVASLTKTGTDAGNYTISNIVATDIADITPKALTVTGTTTADKVYNGDMTSSTTVGTLSGLVGSETLSASVIGTFSDKNAAIGKTVTDAYILANGTGLASNYSLADTTSTATITPKALTMTGTTTADKIYNGDMTSSTTVGTLSGLIGSETLSASVIGTFSDKNAAIDKTVTDTYILANGTGLASNYSLADTTSTATITPKALIVTATNASKTYDGLAYSGGNGVSYNGFVNSETASVLNGTLSYGGTSQSAINVGNYVITLSGLSSSNYILNYVNGTLTINQLGPTAAELAAIEAKHIATEAQTIATQIVNGTAIKPPMLPNVTPPTTPIAQFSSNGQTYDVFLQPIAGIATQEMSLPELSRLRSETVSGVRIPLLQGILLNFTQGGINLPDGLDQLFYIAQR